MQECFSFCVLIPRSWWILLSVSSLTLSLIVSFLTPSLTFPFLLLGPLSWRNVGYPIIEKFSMIVCAWVCVLVERSRPVHVWLTASFDSSRCHGDLLNSTAPCFLHLLFSLRTNECRLPGRLQWLPEWALNLQWKAANIPEWQKRKDRPRIGEGEIKREDEKRSHSCDAF